MPFLDLVKALGTKKRAPADDDPAPPHDDDEKKDSAPPREDDSAPLCEDSRNASEKRRKRSSSNNITTCGICGSSMKTGSGVLLIKGARLTSMAGGSTGSCTVDLDPSFAIRAHSTCSNQYGGAFVVNTTELTRFLMITVAHYNRTVAKLTGQPRPWALVDANLWLPHTLLGEQIFVKELEFGRTCEFWREFDRCTVIHNNRYDVLQSLGNNLNQTMLRLHLAVHKNKSLRRELLEDILASPLGCDVTACYEKVKPALPIRGWGGIQKERPHLRVLPDICSDARVHDYISKLVEQRGQPEHCKPDPAGETFMSASVGEECVALDAKDTMEPRGLSPLDAFFERLTASAARVTKLALAPALALQELFTCVYGVGPFRALQACLDFDRSGNLMVETSLLHGSLAPASAIICAADPAQRCTVNDSENLTVAQQRIHNLKVLKIHIEARACAEALPDQYDSLREKVLFIHSSVNRTQFGLCEKGKVSERSADLKAYMDEVEYASHKGISCGDLL